MRNVLILEDTMKKIGKAIREKTGKIGESYYPSEMPAQIASIQGDSSPVDNYVQDGLVSFFSLEGDEKDYFNNSPISYTTMSFIEDDTSRLETRQDGYTRYNVSSLSSSDFTISFWLKSDKYTGSYICSLGDYAGTNPYIIILVKDIVMGQLGIETAQGSWTLASGTDFFDNKWRNISVTYSASKINVYIDGALKQTIDSTCNIGYLGRNVLAIGNWVRNDWSTGPGTKLSRFMLYNRGLSSDEIIHNYKADEKLYKEKQSITEKKFIPVDYIYSEVQNHAIYLDIKNSTNIELDIDFEMDDINNSTLFGRMSGTMYYLNWYGGKFYFGMNSSSDQSESSNVIPPSTRQMIKFNTPGHKIIQLTSDKENVMYVGQPEMSEGFYNIPLFCGSRGSMGWFAKAKIYSVKVIDNTNGNTIKDFIPVKDSKGRACLYEKNNKIFYYNNNVQSNAGFTCGQNN